MKSRKTFGHVQGIRISHVVDTFFQSSFVQNTYSCNDTCQEMSKFSQSLRLEAFEIFSTKKNKNYGSSGDFDAMMMSDGVAYYYNDTTWPQYEEMWHHEQHYHEKPSQYSLELYELRTEVQHLRKQVDALRHENQEAQKKMLALKKEFEGLAFHNRSNHFSTARKVDLLSERIDYIRNKSKSVPQVYYMVPVTPVFTYSAYTVPMQQSQQNVQMQPPHQDQMKSQMTIEELA